MILLPRVPLLVALALLVLLVADAAEAGGPFARDLELDLPRQRGGDLLRYEVTHLGKDGEAVVTGVLVQVEGPARATDRFGLDVATEAFRFEASRDGRVLLSARCHGLAGAPEGVRADVLAGSKGHMGSASARGYPLVADRVQSARFDIRVDFPGACPGRSGLAGQRLAEGARLGPEALMAFGVAIPGVPAASGPGVEASFAGRPALVFPFRLQLPSGAEGGWANVTYARGLAAPVGLDVAGAGLVRTEFGFVDTGAMPLRARLTGFVPGEDPPLDPVAPGVRTAAPADAWASPSPRSLDDRAFDLPYPFAEAFESLLADPAVCLASFLGEHPDALLTRAEYDRAARDPLVPHVPTQGSWSLTFRSGPSLCSAFSVRLSSPAPLSGGATRNYPEEFPLEEARAQGPMPDAPERVPSSVHLARMLRAEGIDRVAWIHYSIKVQDEDGSAVRIVAGNVPLFGPENEGRYHGRLASVDARAGGLAAIYVGEGNVEEGLFLDPTVSVSLRETALPAASGLEGPGVGEGLAGAAVGMGLLLAVGKLLAPLYTRLRRATLLDHPLRARLYERVRVEPGIHRAGLVEFLGAGSGATTRHLDQLVRHGFLAEIRVDGRARYYASGDVPPDVARREAVLRAGRQRDVYDLYAAEPALSLRQAAARLGMSAPAVHRAKKRLEKAGLLPAAPVVEVRLEG